MISALSSMAPRGIQKHLYRLKIGGPRQLARDVVQVTKQSFLGVREELQIHSIGDSHPAIRILFIHQGWAVYDVGRLWFSSVPGLQCTFARIEQFLKHPSLQNEHDIVCFGYSYLYELAYGLVRGRAAWVCVHDPRELYPEVPTWKTAAANAAVVARLKSADRILVTSKEMDLCVREQGLRPVLIPTASSLPLRRSEELQDTSFGPVKAITIGRIYPRKHFELFTQIVSVAKQRLGGRVQLTAKWDFVPLPRSEYIAKLDSQHAYICTSYQEGGPLPAMDAMQRGLLVLSTPVGQIPELIIDGKNGFICKTVDEFVERLRLLTDEWYIAATMRREALVTIERLRSATVIVAAVSRALELHSAGAE